VEVAPSVTSILARPFEELTLDDIANLVADPDDPESIVLEVKQDANPKAIARSCAAFANRIGGLFIGGVTKAGKLDGLPPRPPRRDSGSRTCSAGT
jgi:hypothetical protein